MWTQSDQLQAQRFMRRRVISGLSSGDANHPVPPARRLMVCYPAGLICALLITVGFAIYGLLRPGR